MKRNIIVIVVVAVLMAGFVILARERTGAISPPVKGYLEGQEIRFVHTETSDARVNAVQLASEAASRWYGDSGVAPDTISNAVPVISRRTASSPVNTSLIAGA